MTQKEPETGAFQVLFIGTGSFFAAYPLKAVARQFPLAGIIESARLGFDSHSLTARLSLWLEQRLAVHSLYRVARQLNVPYYFLEKGDEASLSVFIASVRPTIGVIASMNHLLPQSILAIPPCGFINMHPSLLPDLRGPHVWTWLYYYNDRQGGVTIHQVDAGEDSGAILQQESFPIFPGMPPGRLEDTAVRLGTRLLLTALEDAHLGRSDPLPQAAGPNLRRARRLKDGENLFNYSYWDIQHTFHFLQGAMPWYSPFRLRKFSAGILDWKITGFSSAQTQQTSGGGIFFDWRGFYFSHPAGKIRLRMKVNLYYLVLFLLLVLAMINMIQSR